jgi:hypothetical protein
MDSCRGYFTYVLEIRRGVYEIVVDLVDFIKFLMQLLIILFNSIMMFNLLWLDYHGWNLLIGLFVKRKNLEFLDGLIYLLGVLKDSTYFIIDLNIIFIQMLKLCLWKWEI